MKNEYIILNKTQVEKRIEELEVQREREPDNYTQSYLNGKIKQLNEILPQSIPLIPEIKKAYNWGYTECEDGCEQDPTDCISNLKLDI